MLLRIILASVIPSTRCILVANLTIAGEKTGPVTGLLPPLSSETSAALQRAANTDPLGQHAGGKDGGDQEASKKVKSEKERMDDPI